MSKSLLRLRGLNTVLSTEDGPLQAAEDVSFDLDSGEILGIVGESGSGKSITALSIMRLIGPELGYVEAQELTFCGDDLLAKSEREMQQIRGADIAMVFQEPTSALNPVFTIGEQITETLIFHEGLSRRAARDRAIEMLVKVGIASPKQRIDEYPHQLSGGMRQRAMIAMALACGPKILIADEPTTALDVTIQAQILDLLLHLQQELGMAVILITHDLGVVAEFADRVVVMYAARVIEQGSVSDVFGSPAHPYTRDLLASTPAIDEEQDRLTPILGTVPNLLSPPSGCRFHPRCRDARGACSSWQPRLQRLSSDHLAACIAHT